MDQRRNLSVLALKNVEALAQSEGGGSGQCVTCYKELAGLQEAPTEGKTYCGDCKPIACTHWWDSGRCMR